MYSATHLQLACAVFALNAVCVWAFVAEITPKPAPTAAVEGVDSTSVSTARAIWESLSPPVQRLLVVRICISWAVMLLRSSVSLLLEYKDLGYVVGVKEKGYVISVFSIVGVIAQFAVVPQASQLASEKRLVIISSIGMAVGGVGIAVASGMRGLFGALIVVAVASSLLKSNFQSVLSKTVETHQYGAVLGISGTVDSVTRAATPFVSGLLMDAFGPAASAVASAIFAIATTVAASHFVPEVRTEKLKAT